jgi:hypothetical protein
MRSCWARRWGRRCRSGRGSRCAGTAVSLPTDRTTAMQVDASHQMFVYPATTSVPRGAPIRKPSSTRTEPVSRVVRSREQQPAEPKERVVLTTTGCPTVSFCTHWRGCPFAAPHDVEWLGHPAGLVDTSRGNEFESHVATHHVGSLDARVAAPGLRAHADVLSSAGCLKTFWSWVHD